MHLFFNTFFTFNKIIIISSKSNVNLCTNCIWIVHSYINTMSDADATSVQIQSQKCSKHVYVTSKPGYFSKSISLFFSWSNSRLCISYIQLVRVKIKTNKNYFLQSRWMQTKYTFYLKLLTKSKAMFNLNEHPVNHRSLLHTLIHVAILSETIDTI